MSKSKIPEYITIGHIGSAYGLKGWVNIISYTQPKTNIIDYSPWYLKITSNNKNEQYQLVNIEQIRKHGKGIVALLPDCPDRTAAESLKNTEIAILTEQLPVQPDDEYYWRDLIGLNVTTTNEIALGKVSDLIETGANDVLVVEQKIEDKIKTRLIPFIRPDVVVKINLEMSIIVVDWDPDF
ncbi:MAG: ribosome maturation factor RimM [Gammaproteobacteria bacterium]